MHHQVPECDFDDMFVRAHSEVPSEQRFANLSRVVKAGVLERLRGFGFHGDFVYGPGLQHVVEDFSHLPEILEVVLEATTILRVVQATY